MLIYSRDIRWFYTIVILGFVHIIQVGIKYFTKPLNLKWLKRPDEARNCDLFSTNGKVAGQSGFPSGHVSEVTAFFVSIYFLFPQYRNYKYIGIIWIALMIYSRIAKKCHTFLQTIAGLSLGIAVPLIILKLL
jgi:membrane-associated phospholipid phosphatase